MTFKCGILLMKSVMIYLKKLITSPLNNQKRTSETIYDLKRPLRPADLPVNLIRAKAYQNRTKYKIKTSLKSHLENKQLHLLIQIIPKLKLTRLTRQNNRPNCLKWCLSTQGLAIKVGHKHPNLWNSHRNRPTMFPKKNWRPILQPLSWNWSTIQFL